MQKRLVLVCEGSLCPRKLPDVSGPGLGEAGRYREMSWEEAPRAAVLEPGRTSAWGGSPAAARRR